MASPPPSSFRLESDRLQAPPAGSPGFTLLELLVCLVIGAVMITGLFRSISAQGQMTDVQSAREEVQQNSRAALELIASELRAISTAGAIVRAARDSVTFRTTRLWGVVCPTSPDSLDLLISEVDARHFAPTSGSVVLVNLGTIRQPIWTDAAPVQAATRRSGGCRSPATDSAAVRLTLQIGTAPRSGSDVPQAGDLAGIFDQITYRSGTSSGVRGRWIQRRSGDGSGSTNQPLAGPIRGAGVGLRFRYFGADGRAMAGTIVNPALRDSIVGIEVLVDAISLDRAGNVRASRRDSVTVPLRNRR